MSNVFLKFKSDSKINKFISFFSYQDIPMVSQKPDVPKVSSKAKRFLLLKSKSKEEKSTRKRGPKTLLRYDTEPRPGRVIRERSQEEDVEESKNFLKLNVKYITDGEVGSDSCKNLSYKPSSPVNFPLQNVRPVSVNGGHFERRLPTCMCTSNGRLLAAHFHSSRQYCACSDLCVQY